MSNYGLSENYQARLTPEYFNDVLPDAGSWQADVYRRAVTLGHRADVTRLIDIGCGTASKLIARADDFLITGYDYGDNIQYCRNIAPKNDWRTANLETEIINDDFSDSVVIVADIIEHLINPSCLIATLHLAVQTAAYVLISTPDRERLQQGTENGPPANKSHTREWRLDELEQWFVSEGLPVKWAGWTCSYDKQPDKLNTCLIVLSNKEGAVDMPFNFEPAPHWRKSAAVKDGMLKVWMTPTPSEASRDLTNAINLIVHKMDKYLPDYGVQLVEEPDSAQVHAGHAGQGSQSPIDVCHFHGLYNTAQGSENFAVNAAVIRNLKTARIITAPSEWIADVIRRDMHVNPRVIGWGVDTDEWTPVENPDDYAIWSKARVDNISTPEPMLALAAMAHDVLFLSTFGEGATPNVKVVGRQPYEIMKQHVRHAAVMLSLNVETMGLANLEAMAAGVPILAFKQGAQVDYIQHGVNGFLAEVGDMEGLYEGLRYCLKHRKQLGQNARERAKLFTWQETARQFAGVFFDAMTMKADIRPHHIDESLYKE